MGVMSFDVELPLPPKELSPNARVHYMVRARATKQHRHDCYLVMLGAKPKGWEGNSPIELDFVYRAFRGCGGAVFRDCTNALSACKALIDGIVDAGVVPNDSKRWLSIGHFKLMTTAREAKNCPGVFVRVRRQS